MSVATIRRRLPVVALGALLILGMWSSAARAARAWQPPVALSATDADAWIGKPVAAVAFDGLGDATAAWRERSDTGWTIAGRTLSRLGVPGPRQELGGGYNPPTVASSGIAGRAIAAWVGSTTPGQPGGNVLVAETDPTGTFGAPRAVAQTSEFYDQPGAAVAANAAGDAVVVYAAGTVDDKRLMRVRRAADGTWGEPEAVTPQLGANVWRLSVTMSAAGEIAYAWYSWIPAQGTRAGVVTELPDGTRTPVRQLNEPDAEAGAPSLAMDAAGNAIVTWPALRDDAFAGPVNAAVKAALLPFGPAVELDGSASDHAGAPVALSAAGVAIVAWAQMTPTSPTTGYGGGARLVAGQVPTGTFGRSEAVVDDLASDPVAVAVDPLGDALVFFTDWDTNEARVVRRGVNGFFGQPRNAVPCPTPGVWPLAAHVGALGDAALVWTENNWLKRGPALMVSRDTAATSFSPDPCAAGDPWLRWTTDPQPGVPVDFDAIGADDPDAASVHFQWDLDGDGVFELDTGADRHARSTYDSVGVHHVGLRVTQFSARPGNSVTWTCSYEVRVGMPPLPPETATDPWGSDPRPSDDPDELPWPVAQRAGGGTAPVVEVPVLPVLGGLVPSAKGATVRQPAGVALELVTAGRIRRGELARLGLPVTVRAAASGPVRVRLRGAGRTLVSRRVTLRAGRARTLRLRPAARGRAVAARARLTVEARGPRDAVSRAVVRATR